MGVRYLLTGNVLRSDSRVRVQARLIEGSTGRRVWTDRFDDTLDDIFALYDRIAVTVAGRIDASISDAEINRAVQRPTQTAGAVELFWRANAKLRAMNPVNLADAIELVRHEFSREGIDWRVSVQPGLPRLRGDRLQLEQVLVNLMLNASQAMAGQPPPRRLQVSAEAGHDGTLAIAVADNGPGIAEEDRQRLFEPFFTTKAQGMGMGLAICRSTAEAHGGQLSVDSAPGRGTVFRLLLAPANA